MGVLLALKWAGQRVTPQTAGGVGSVAAVAPAGSDAEVGMALPAEARDQARFQSAEEYSQSPGQPAQVNSTRERVEEQAPEIKGPATMSHDKCMALYGKYSNSVAFYGQVLGADNAGEYAACHAISNSDDSFCGLLAGRANQQCVSAVFYHKTIYSAIIGKMDMQLCRKYFAMQKAYMPAGTPPVDKLCKTIEDTIGGPKAQQALTACPGSKDKRDCVLHADVLAGVKQGKGRLWLYDALTGKGCAKADTDLVDQYCSGKIVPPTRSQSNKK